MQNTLPPGLIFASPAAGTIQISALPPLVLVTGIVDDSGSISSYHNDGAIRAAHNELLDGYKGAAQSVLVRTRFLNGGGLSDEYQRPESAPRMTPENYNPHLDTPLYNQTPLALSEILAATKRFGEKHSVYTMTYLMTDGADTEGGDVAKTRRIVETMFTSGRHVVAGIAVEDGHTDFHQVFRNMGIPEQWIKVLKRNDNDIRRGMGDFSRVTRNVTHAGGFNEGTFTHATQVGFAAAPKAPVGTAPAGARTVANMAGAMTTRTPHEKGEVSFAQITWSPVPLAYTYDPTTRRWDRQNLMIQTPFSWDAQHSMYSLRMPDEDVGYIIGRGGGTNWEASTLAKIQEIIEQFFKAHPTGKLYYIPVNNPERNLSRVHALITRPNGMKQCDIKALKGDVTVIKDDDPAHDRYLQADRDELELVGNGKRVKLTPSLIFRTI